MAGREGVRSSARLSAAGSAAAGAGGGPEPGAAEAQRAAAAALRRARAARAAERAAEVEDSPQVLRDKCRRLARALRDAKHLVVSAPCATFHLHSLTYLNFYCASLQF